MRACFILLLMGASLMLNAQHPAFKQYTVKDGLASGTVYQAIQDKNGYIWFATNQGVSRFDGHTFKNFSKDDGLPDNDIIKLYLDSHNNIWFVSLVGIPSLYTDGKIISFPGCKNINAITEDIQLKKIYLISADFELFGYYESSTVSHEWNFTEHIASRTKSEKNIFNTPVLRYADNNMKVYFSFNLFTLTCTVLKKDGIKEYTYKSADENLLSPYGKPNFFSVDSKTSRLLFRTMDSIYICTDSGVTPIASLKKLQLNEHEQHDLSSMLYENDSRIWLSTRNHGLICITEFMKPTRKIEYYFQQSFCSSIIKDREGSFWVTTHNDGVYYIPNLSFRTIAQPNQLIGKDVKTIKTTSSRSIVAGFADGNITEIEPWTLKSKSFSKWLTANKNNRVMDLYPTAGSILAATDKGLHLLSFKDEYITLSVAASKSISVDQDNNIITAFAHGVELRKNGKASTLYKGRATCVTSFAGKYFWGTLKGLYMTSGNKVVNLGLVYPAAAGMINDIDISTDTAIWLCTVNGIIVIKNNKSYNITKKQGLPSNTCKHVLFDDQTAWVSTDNGLAKIDYRWKNGIPLYRISTITEADGLSSKDVNDATLSNNFIWVATSAGISYFPKEFSTESTYDPEININKIIVGSQEQAVSNKIFIKPQQSLSIQLSGISYRSGKELSYEYRFSNIEKAWKKLSSNKIEFTALPYGTYKLDIRAIDRWGNKTKNPVSLGIFNAPPFWKTSWFEAIIYVLSIVITALLLLYYSIRRQGKKEKEFYEKKKVLELEMMAFRAQINPHFLFNCLTSIQHHILKSDPVSANHYLNKLSTLIRKTLQSSASPTISVAEEISIINIFMELQKLRLEERLHYVVACEDELLVSNISIPSMIIQPFIENAVKHGISPLADRRGSIIIDFKKIANSVLCRIEDNGIGINASKDTDTGSGYSSMGSNITIGRINAINALEGDQIILDIKDKKEFQTGEQGTIVTITFILKSGYDYQNRHH